MCQPGNYVSSFIFYSFLHPIFAPPAPSADDDGQISSDECRMHGYITFVLRYRMMTLLFFIPKVAIILCISLDYVSLVLSYNCHGKLSYRRKQPEELF